MCWVNNKLEILTAETNIYVWKLISIENNEYRSLYQGFNYEIGITYQEQIDPYRTALYYHCNEGFHSYDEKIQIRYHDIGGMIIISNTNTGRVLNVIRRNYEDCKIMECIIPKGSKYLVNYNHEYVSECIKPIDVYDIEKTSELSKYLI